MKAVLLILVVWFVVCPGHAAEIRACPPWEITVVDEQGQPVADCTVLQEWGCRFGKRAVTDSTNAITDASGQIHFPARSINPPASETGVRKLARLVDGQGRGEPWANIYVAKSGHQGLWVYSWNDPNVVATAIGFRSRIILKTAKPDDLSR